MTRELSERTASHSMKALMTLLDAAGVPCGPVNTIDQVFEEPQAKHRGLEITQTRPDLSAPIRTVANPIRMSRTPPRYDRPPPRLGEHTEEVTAEAAPEGSKTP